MQTELAKATGGTLAQAGAAADAIAGQLTWSDYVSGRSANTLRAQAGDLEAFRGYLASVGVSDVPTAAALMESPQAWAGVTGGLILSFREWQMQQGYAIGTVNRQLATLRTYAKMANIGVQEAKGFGYKVGRKRDEKRTEAGVTTRKGAKKAYKAVTLTLEGAKALHKHPDTPQGRRDAFLMCLLLDHGLRCGEVAILAVENFDSQSGVFRFYRPKVDKVQSHRMTPATKAAFEAYKAHMPVSGALLRSSRKGGALTHEGMTERSITARVRDLGKEIGIDNLSAHDCRHYWATRATEAGTHPRRLQQAGGWNSPAMVMRYVNEAEIANEGVIL